MLDNLSAHHIYILFIIMALCEILTQFSFKQAAEDSKNSFNKFYFIGLITINITYFLYYKIIRTGKHLSVIHAIHHTIVLLAITLGSFYIFNQKLNFYQILALIGLIISTSVITMNEY
tara:strand:+ start:375 stop:728 length:354 start_codon:yes stop_codon:yes gene_type:complete